MDKRENLRENAYRPMTDPWGTPNTIIAASLFYQQIPLSFCLLLLCC